MYDKELFNEEALPASETADSDDISCAAMFTPPALGKASVHVLVAGSGTVKLEWKASCHPTTPTYATPDNETTTDLKATMAAGTHVIDFDMEGFYRHIRFTVTEDGGVSAATVSAWLVSA